MSVGGVLLPFLVEFAPKPNGYDTDELSALMKRVLGRTVTFFDVETSSVFQMGSSGLSPEVDGEIGLQIRVGASAVLALDVTVGEVARLGNLSNVFLIEKDPALSVLDVRTDLLAAGASLERIGARAAWTRTRGEGVRIAVLDSGIDGAHPDLEGITAWTFVPRTTPEDVFGHGTRCAGILAARGRGNGIVGVAPDATVYSLKVLDDQGRGRGGWMVAAAFWCVLNGVQVASVCAGWDQPSLILEWLFEEFASKVLFVAAAGNRGQQGGEILAPALYQSVVAVSALDQEDRLAVFSSYGPQIEIAAPGTFIVTTTPDGGYISFDGTSAACPHVAGTAALVFSRYRGATPEWVRHRLKTTARGLPHAAGAGECFGAGLVDADKATR